MKDTTSVTTFGARAVARLGEALFRILVHATTSIRSVAGLGRTAKRVGPSLLLVLPFVVTLVPEVIDSTRIIDVTVSRYAFSPERIEVQVGERIRLNVVSNVSTHGFQIKALGLNATIPAGGKTVTLELTPKEAGTFAITCSEYCGRGHRSMKGSLIVTPGT